MQLIIDLFDCSHAKLDDVEAIGALLVQAPDGLGIVPAQDQAAHVWTVRGGPADGVGGVLQLNDGVLEIFTNVMFGLAWVSLFRTGDFGHDAAAAWFVQQLGAETADLQVVQRGPQIRAPRPGPTVPWMRTGKPA